MRKDNGGFSNLCRLMPDNLSNKLEDQRSIKLRDISNSSHRTTGYSEVPKNLLLAPLQKIAQYLRLLYARLGEQCSPQRENLGLFNSSRNLPNLAKTVKESGSSLACPPRCKPQGTSQALSQLGKGARVY